MLFPSPQDPTHIDGKKPPSFVCMGCHDSLYSRWEGFQGNDLLDKNQLERSTEIRNMGFRYQMLQQTQEQNPNHFSLQ